MSRAVLAAATALLLLLLGAPAWAQSTGSSFGGGSFGSSGSSSSSSSGSSSSSSGSSGSSWGSGSSSSSSSSSYGGGSVGGGGALLGILVLGVVVLAVVGLVAQLKPAVQGGAAPVVGPSVAEMHTSELALGIDWRARAELQQGLARMAASGDTASEAGRARLLGEAALALRRAELSWMYAGYQDLGWRAPAESEKAFRNSAADARARFQRELIRNADGTVTEGAAPAGLVARPEEGPGLIVVTVVTVARRKLIPVADLRDATSIRDALDDRCLVSADELVAFEVIWSPAAEEDRMSSAELEQHYADLTLIDPGTIAGRVICSYCQGPFPMELLKCPHCGAAVDEKPAGAPKSTTAQS